MLADLVQHGFVDFYASPEVVLADQLLSEASGSLSRQKPLPHGAQQHAKRAEWANA